MFEETLTGRPHDTSVQKATSDNENVDEDGLPEDVNIVTKFAYILKFVLPDILSVDSLLWIIETYIAKKNWVSSAYYWRCSTSWLKRTSAISGTHA